MRVFRDCEEMIKEMDRELKVSGITVPVKHYQNKKLQGEDQFTKELIGVSFTISKPLNGRSEMLRFMFKDEWEKIQKYCVQEHKDRTFGIPMNPGSSYKIRQDLWQKFMVDNGTKFDYTYSERLHWQLKKIVEVLKEDKHSRQAILQIFQSNIDIERFGGDTRIPCSLDYQILIRNNRLYVIYHMRSNDYFAHFAIDIWLAAQMIMYFVDKLKGTYKELKPGSLIYFAGSLHAYRWDLNKWVIF